MENRSSLIDKREGVRLPSFGEAVFLLSFITVSLIIGIMVFHLDVHILLIISVVLTMLLCWRCGYNLDQQIEIMGNSLKNATGAMFAFLLIGMIIGIWILAGTIPALIYYGLDIVSPALFLPAGFLVCCGITYATGTNWGAASTIGVALIGMGISLGVPLPVIAGMIISGGVFGVNLSPLSDVTILSSATAGTTVSDHLKAVSKVNRIVFVLSAAAYYFMGAYYAGSETGGTEHIIELQHVLSQTFDMNFLVLAPIVITLAMTFAKIPSQVALFCGIIVGGVVAAVVQGNSLHDIFAALNYGFTHATGYELADTLLVRGGIQSMMWTFSLAFIALCMGGLLEKAHFLTVMLEKILPKLKSNVSLVFTTLCTCVLGNVTTSEVYLSMILNGSLYKEVYAQRGFKPEMLSRLLSEGSMTSGMLLPWTTAGAFMTATLGVSPLVYAPYAVYVWLTPIVSLLLVGMGRTLIKYEPAQGYSVPKDITN
ncbi:Na+/H+ antiporter NhaC family protein [Photobacterium sanguinicancri]|uniref:Na+/H+ antiporter NhaC family protein n=1 Tax=Photobacterium sanguinicancri TaxID=875932 RepID=A0AAW7Y0K2_9GAMM|nr:Na+/H+ antiporter NhaC family protein [Photobacterium sanguinicancri]MDO6542121.1 Na+/H+ antiporter NhaC family protein [Photobacterium sanguinicancri]